MGSPVPLEAVSLFSVTVRFHLHTSPGLPTLRVVEHACWVVGCLKKREWPRSSRRKCCKSLFIELRSISILKPNSWTDNQEWLKKQGSTFWKGMKCSSMWQVYLICSFRVFSVHDFCFYQVIILLNCCRTLSKHPLTILARAQSCAMHCQGIGNIVLALVELIVLLKHKTSSSETKGASEKSEVGGITQWKNPDFGVRQQ